MEDSCKVNLNTYDNFSVVFSQGVKRQTDPAQSKSGEPQQATKSQHDKSTEKVVVLFNQFVFSDQIFYY